jgi:dihydroorotase
VPLSRIVEAVTAAPAKLLGLDRGTLAPGSVADMVLVDLEAPFLFSEDRIRSRSKNTAFEDARFQGQVLRTFVAGRTVFSESDRSGG